jgi:imidazolonepropionase
MQVYVSPPRIGAGPTPRKRTERATLLVEHAAELATLAHPYGFGPRAGLTQSDPGLVHDAAIAVGEDGRILAVGRTAGVRESVDLAPKARVIDAAGRAIVPGFVDAQTHAAFPDEAEGAPPGRGGGPHALPDGTPSAAVRAVRAADERALVAALWRRLDGLLALGTTSVEIASGYGLTLDAELKQLRAARAMAEVGPLTVVPTFMGARTVPPEYAGDPDAYVELVRRIMLPAVAGEKLAELCGVACGPGGFTSDQVDLILDTARDLGLELKIRADRRDPSAAVGRAAEHGVVSVERIERASDADLALLEEAGAVAVLAPTPSPAALVPRVPLGRRMIDRAIPVALGSGFAPGYGAPPSMATVIALACERLGLTPAEALVAATVNAAFACGLGSEVGSLEPGRRADFLILDAPSYTHLPYRSQANLVRTVVKDGWVVVDEGRRIA